MPVITAVVVNGQTFRGSSFEIPAMPSVRIEVQTGAGGGVAGTVLASGDWRPEQGTVTVVPVPTGMLDMGLVRFAKPDHNGVFSIAGLTPEKYRVCAWMESGERPAEFLSDPKSRSDLDQKCVTVDIENGRHSTVSPKPISIADFLRR